MSVEFCERILFHLKVRGVASIAEAGEEEQGCRVDGLVVGSRSFLSVFPLLLLPLFLSSFPFLDASATAAATPGGRDAPMRAI